jgi:hypothetical protein
MSAAYPMMIILAGGDEYSASPNVVVEWLTSYPEVGVQISVIDWLSSLGFFCGFT